MVVIFQIKISFLVLACACLRLCHENFYVLSHLLGDKEDHLLNLLHDTHGAN